MNACGEGPTTTRPGAGAGGDADDPQAAQADGDSAPDAGAPNGGQGGQPFQPARGFRVLDTDPHDASLEAEPDGTVVITFSDALDAATITTKTVELEDVFLKTSVPAELSVEGDQLSITPTKRLGLVAEYAVNIDRAVAAHDGMQLADDFHFAFTVREGIWKETLLGTGEITYMSENLGLDDAGTAFISWIQRDSNAYCPTVVRRVALLGEPDEPQTLTPTTIQSDCRNARNSTVGVDLAATSWEEDTGTYVTQYRDGQWVGGEPLVKPWTMLQSTVQLAPNGAVHLLVWNGTAVVARHTSPMGAWLTQVDTLTAERFYSSPSVAFWPDGDGLAAWRSRDTDAYEKILVSRYSQAEDKWLPASKVPGSVAPQANATHFRGSPRVVINAAGTAVVLWVRGAELGTQLYANVFEDGNWQPPDLVSRELGGLVFQEPPGLVAVGDDFVAAWNQSVAGLNNTYTARFTQGVWSEPELRSDGVTTGGTRMPRLGVDEHQNLLLLWPRAGATVGNWDYVQTRYRQATDSWSEPTANMSSPIVDPYLDESAADDSVPNYNVALPFSVAPNGVAAVGFANRLAHPRKQYLTDPTLAVLQ